MRILSFVASALLVGAGYSSSSLAQGITAVRPLQGYACKALKMSERQMTDPYFVVPMLSQPSPMAAPVGRAASIVIVESPPRVVNGYLAAILLNGSPAWISAEVVKPWESFGKPKQECIPSVMSNGRIGFDFRNQGSGG